MLTQLPKYILTSYYRFKIPSHYFPATRKHFVVIFVVVHTLGYYMHFGLLDGFVGFPDLFWKSILLDKEYIYYFQYLLAFVVNILLAL